MLLVASTVQLYSGSSRNSVASVMAPDWVSMKRTVVRERHIDCRAMYTRSANRRNGLVGMLYSV
jgi:hypothetical protein